MKRNSIILAVFSIIAVIALSKCQNMQYKSAEAQPVKGKMENGGFESQVKWGEHLVTITGCNDCHTPKKFGEHGMVIDSALLLSGHIAQMPAPEIDRKLVESKGLVVSNTLTAWAGPWGISYSTNLTSDPTGIGNWEEENFIYALRNGKFKGISKERTLLPPMPWEMYKHMSDDEIRAIFAYLKSTKPISNIVPDAQPPISTAKK